MKRLYGLIGYPLEHSFSPGYFKQKFAALGLNDAEYRLFPLKNIADFSSFLKDHTNLAGLNVTIPYKEKIMDYLDEIDPAAGEIGAVNTVQISQKSEKKYLKGFNTDFIGFRESIERKLQPSHRKALVLGTGGSSKAVVYALRLLNIPCQLVSRTAITGALSYQDLDAEFLRDYQIIVNTTPLGMFPHINQAPEIPYHLLNNSHLLFDLIYNPEETRFLQKGKEQGAATVNGQEMLRLQADAAWEIWNKNDISHQQ